MTTYKHLLVPVDESPMSYAAAEQALSLAKDLNCPVTIMSVIAVDPFVGVDFYKVAPAITDYFMQAEQNAQNRLAEIQQSFSREGISVDTKIILLPPSCIPSIVLAHQLWQDDNLKSFLKFQA